MNAKRLKPETASFSDIAAYWLDSRRRFLQPTTVQEYKSIINCYFEAPLGQRAMADIGFFDLDQLFSKLQVSNKTFNNILSALRCIYSYAINAGAVTMNLAEKIEFAPKDEPTPDPLTIEEISTVLQDMQQHYPEPVVIYFQLAFRIGFRPSEGINLRWSNVDWDSQLLEISSAKVRRIEKSTKTNKVRYVELSDDSIELLKRLRQHSGHGEHLFLYPETGRPYPDTSYLVQKYWRPSLARCAIRDRDARQTRHTCATMLLMGGARDRWAAEQLGHSVEMFQRVYSKWLPKNDGRRELAKASAMFARIQDSGIRIQTDSR